MSDIWIMRMFGANRQFERCERHWYWQPLGGNAITFGFFVRDECWHAACDLFGIRWLETTGSGPHGALESLERKVIDRLAFAAPAATEDKPELDGTDATHPAWRRGREHGSIQTAKALQRVAKYGRNGGSFGAPELEAAAQAIEAVRRRCTALLQERDDEITSTRLAEAAYQALRDALGFPRGWGCDTALGEARIMRGTVDDQDKAYAALQSERDAYRQALERIADPARHGGNFQANLIARGTLGVRSAYWRTQGPFRSPAADPPYSRDEKPESD